jgi:translation initiation factor 3 subunit D
MSDETPVTVRTTVHAVQRKREATEPQYLSVFALNEWDSKLAGSSDFRQFVDTQRGNVLATEIKNNSNRLAKYTLSALLAGNDSIRLGFVSRQRRADGDNHQILGVASIVPTTFAAQVAINYSNAWGIFRWLVDAVRKHAKNLQTEDEPDDEYVAKFVLLRDPHKPCVRLFNIPVDAFEREAEISDLDEEWGEERAGVESAAAPAEDVEA